MKCPYCGSQLKRSDNDEDAYIVTGDGPIEVYCEKKGCTFEDKSCGLLLHHPFGDERNDVRNTERGPGDSWSLSYIK